MADMLKRNITFQHYDHDESDKTARITICNICILTAQQKITDMVGATLKETNSRRLRKKLCLC